jgi:hypothetical protein
LILSIVILSRTIDFSGNLIVRKADFVGAEPVSSLLLFLPRAIQVVLLSESIVGSKNVRFVVNE